MFSHPLIRLLIGAPLAALVVFGLFTFMRLAISGNFEEPEDREQRVLEALVPQEESTEIRRSARSKPRKLDSADKPPPPPKLTSSKSDIDLPTPSIQGAAPTELKLDRMSSMAIDPVAISDRDAQPISPPQVTYPQRAAERGIEGSCEVRFNVNARGEPYDVDADCTDSVFVREAERSVSRVRFAPKIVRGSAVERANVVYPLQFDLAD
ncbi:MAG: TonB family protein [Pseudomonadota bacterium]